MDAQTISPPEVDAQLQRVFAPIEIFERKYQQNPSDPLKSILVTTSLGTYAQPNANLTPAQRQIYEAHKANLKDNMMRLRQLAINGSPQVLESYRTAASMIEDRRLRITVGRSDPNTWGFSDDQFIVESTSTGKIDVNLEFGASYPGEAFDLQRSALARTLVEAHLLETGIGVDRLGEGIDRVGFGRTQDFQHIDLYNQLQRDLILKSAQKYPTTRQGDQRALHELPLADQYTWVSVGYFSRHANNRFSTRHPMDVVTSQLHLPSVVSTPQAQYYSLMMERLEIAAKSGVPLSQVSQIDFSNPPRLNSIGVCEGTMSTAGARLIAQ